MGRGTMATMKELKDIALKLEKLDSEYSKLSWTQYTVGYDFGVDEAYTKMMDFLKDKKNYDLIVKLKEKKDEFGCEDKRRIELIHDTFEPYHLSEELNELSEKIQKKENELSKILNTFRFKLDGKEITSVELSNILSQEEDREKRKRAYLCTTAINKPLVEAGFIELLDLRKQYAKLRGEKDFVQLRLKEDGLDTSVFNGWKEQLHSILPKIQEKRKEYAEKFNNGNKIMPWDGMYVDCKLAPLLNKDINLSDYYEKIREFFMLFDIDIDQYNITYDVFPRANKSEWGYNFPIETGKDSRILANVKNKYFNYGVLLHETGHAVHSFLMDPEMVILNMGVSGIISEGIANLFGQFVHEKIFYEKFFENEMKEAEEQFNNIKEYQKLTALLSICNILFDQELYRNDIKTLDDIYSVYWKMYKEIYNEEPYADEVPWGLRIHHTTHPIYLHNYFMGDVTCEMLAKVFNDKNGTKSITEKPKEFKDFLVKEVIQPSGEYKYGDLFERISGEKFSLKYIL